MKKENTIKKHSVLAPSSAYRWINCSGSVLLPKDDVETDTRAADEGSLAHRIAELKLTASIWDDHQKELEECRCDEIYKPEMEDYVTQYINFIEELNFEERYVEKTVNLDNYVPGLFGTCDCILMDAPKKKLHIIDLKYGFAEVSAMDNPQLRIYAMGAADLFLKKHPEFIDQDFKVKMTIFQPRIRVTSTSDMKYQDLKKWFNQFVRPAAKKIREQKIERTPGDWCQYCDRQIRCDKYNSILTNITITDFFSLTDEQIVENYEKLKEAKKLCDKLKAFMVKQIKEGKTIPGYKLSYPNLRSWDESESFLEAAENYGLYKLMSVSQAEEKYGRDIVNNELGEYIKRTKGNPKLLKEKK